MALDSIQPPKFCGNMEERSNNPQPADIFLNNLYDHFQRPNFYDISGMMPEYLEKEDIWFRYKTEQVSKLYILHLFVCKRNPGSISISVNNGKEFEIINITNELFLNSNYASFDFDDLPEHSIKYLTTYSFSELDVELMRDKKVWISTYISSLNTTVNYNKKISQDMKSLHDFSQLLSDPVGADFIIETGDGARFPVHKFLLIERSKVFRAMLKGDTAENINNHVRINDVEKEDFAALIEFLYTGTVGDLDNKNCFTLLMLADRYMIQGLKELANHVLAQQLSTKNALETLVVADMYNCPVLKFSALKFIKTNVASLNDSIFNEIKNIHLLQELCKYMALKY